MVRRVLAHSGWKTGLMSEALAHQGHGAICPLCSLPCNAMAGNPGLWPIPLPDPDQPGKILYHHMGCVAERLYPKKARP